VSTACPVGWVWKVGGGAGGWVEAGILLGPETTNTFTGVCCFGGCPAWLVIPVQRDRLVGWVLVVGVSVGLRVV
jgi:hypothetical protein